MTRFFLDDIAGDIFVPANPIGRTALFCNGFPGAIGPLPAVLFALARGWHVLFAQYPGTYDSDGRFAVTTASQALVQVVRSAEDGSLRDAGADKSLAPIPPVTLGIGHSFGGFILLDLVARHGKVTSLSHLLLLAPVVGYSRTPDIGTRENLEEHLRYVSKAHPFTYRLGHDDEWHAIANGSFGAPRFDPWPGRVCTLLGDDDDTFAPEVAQHGLAPFIAEALGTAANNVQVQIVRGAGHAMHELLADTSVPSHFLDQAAQAA